MKAVRLRLPSPGLILSLLALFVGLGGTTYAATATTGTGQIKFTNAILGSGWAPAAQAPWPGYQVRDSAAPGYAEDSLGIVHLRGVASESRNKAYTAPIFTLPKGMRPAHTLRFESHVSVYTMDWAVKPSGAVVLPNRDSAVVTFDGVSFAAGE